MSQEPVSNNVLNDFVTVFLRAEGSDEEPDALLWGQVEEMARRAIRQVERVKRPSGVDPSDWDKARECMEFAAHSIVEKDKKGIDITYVLGFLPFIADTMAGAIDKMTSTWNVTDMSQALQYKFEYALKLYPFWITHDTLSGADARDIQLFLQALVAGGKADPMWHQPEAMECDKICVRAFYLPVVYTVHGKMAPEWSPEDVYTPCDFSQKGERAIMASFDDVFTLHGEQDTRLESYEIGMAMQVTNEVRTERDLREIDTRLEMMKSAVTMQEQPEHESRLEIQLTWGAKLGDSIEPEQAPVIRFSAVARNLEEDVSHRLVLGVHVDPNNPESWRESLQSLLAICFRVGWPNVQVKQVSSEQAINYWSEATAPSYVM